MERRAIIGSERHLVTSLCSDEDFGELKTEPLVDLRTLEGATIIAVEPVGPESKGDSDESRVDGVVMYVKDRLGQTRVVEVLNGDSCGGCCSFACGITLLQSKI